MKTLELNKMNQWARDKGWTFVMATFGLALSLLLTEPAAGARKASAKSKAVEEDLKFVAGDEEGNEMKALQAELMINKTEDKAIAQLGKLIHKYKGTAMEPNLHFRLAELYMRKAKSAQFFEVHRDSEKVIKFSPELVKSANSRPWVVKAVDTYESIAHKFTHYRDMDLVLFNNAFARQVLGQDAQAMKLYRQVIQNYTESNLVPDCHLAIGEYYFNNKNYTQAYAEFQEIRKYTDARVYPYGIYKGAWALYNLREGAKALSALEEVIAYAKEGQTAEGGSNRLDLSREALEDMVLFYEDTRLAGDAVNYFRKQGGDEQVGGLILRLGKLYQRHGKFPQVEVVFSDLIRMMPMAAERPQMHRDLMDAFEMTKRRDFVLDQLNTLSDLCSEKNRWREAQKEEARKDCWEELEKASHHYASRWHKDYKKDPVGQKKTGDLARGAYEALLRYDRVGLEEEKFRFSFAELLFQQTNYRRASAEYFKVGSVTKDLKMRHDGSYGALVSLEKATGEKWSDPDEREFQRLASSYVKLNPKGQFVTDVSFKQAFIAYEKGHYEEAAPQLKKLALDHSESDRGRKAAHLFLDILNLQKDYEKLRDESKYFAFSVKGFDDKNRQEFKKVFQESSFAVVQSHENKGKIQQAADEYWAYAQEHKDSALADKALLNGARLYQFQYDFTNASKCLEAVIQNYPKTPAYKDALKSLVSIYENQALLGEAANTILKVAALEPENMKLILAAADYRALSNDWNGARSLYERIYRINKSSPEGRIAIQRLEKSAAPEEIWERMVADDIQPQASLSLAKMAEQAYANKDETKAFNLAKKVIAQRKDKDVSSHALAQARFIQGQILEHEFDQASVKAKPERLSLVIGIKAEKLANAQKAFQEVIGFGDQALAVDALQHLARCYKKFSNALSSIEAPAGLTPDEKKKFLTEMENISTPIEEKNADTLMAALKLAKDIGLHDGTIANIQAELNLLTKKPNQGKLTVEIAGPENVLPLVN